MGNSIFKPLRNGKHYLNYKGFIESVRKGEKSIVFGPNYVVLSRNVYDALVEKASLVEDKKDETRES